MIAHLTCSDCGASFTRERFSGPAPKRCNVCQAAFMKKASDTYRDQHRDRARESNRLSDERRREQRRRERRARQDSKRRFLDAVKATCGCIDCGTREAPLDFDHRPGTIKAFNVSEIARSLVSLIEEMEKCDVRCRTCHQRRHADARRLKAAA
jgi:hypothetical protein